MVFIIQMLYRLVELYSLLLLVYSFLSWFPEGRESSLGRVIDYLVAPILKPFRRFNCYFFGLDWTPLLAIVALRFGFQIFSYLWYFLL